MERDLTASSGVTYVATHHRVEVSGVPSNPAPDRKVPGQRAACRNHDRRAGAAICCIHAGSARSAGTEAARCGFGGRPGGRLPRWSDGVRAGCRVRHRAPYRKRAPAPARRPDATTRPISRTDGGSLHTPGSWLVAGPHRSSIRCLDWDHMQPFPNRLKLDRGVSGIPASRSSVVAAPRLLQMHLGVTDPRCGSHQP